PFVFGSDETQFLPIWRGRSDLRNMSLSTAAMVSSRFPWMTPSASFVEEREGSRREVQLVDGGYYDNSGVASAFALKQAIEVAARELDLADKLQVKLIVLTADLLPSRGTGRFRELL